MRTAWDGDVAARIERLGRERDASLKDIVNDALRRGLDDLAHGSKQKEPFKNAATRNGFQTE
jgi:hypothetical protein